MPKDRYLKPEGTLAFVMPRSVITGAKQHRPFQRRGMTRILDVGNVSPLVQCAFRRTDPGKRRGCKGGYPHQDLPRQIRETRTGLLSKPSRCSLLRKQ